METFKNVMIRLGNSPVWLILIAYICGIFATSKLAWFVMPIMLFVGWKSPDYQRKQK
jgi:hypothetical protein